MLFGRTETYPMIRLVNTQYGLLNNEELDARNGAIALNAMLDSLRAEGRIAHPVMDADFRKVLMMQKILNSLRVEGELPEVMDGTTVSSVQRPPSSLFNALENGLLEALEHVDEEKPAVAPAAPSRKRAA